MADRGKLTNPRYSGALAFANLVLGGAVLCLSVILLYTAADYKRKFVGVGPMLYYLLPAVLLLVCIKGFRCSGRSKIRFAFLIASAATVLYGFEALFSYIDSPDARKNAQPYKAVAESIRNGSYDPRSKLEVVVQLRAEGKSAFPAVFPRHFWPRYHEQELPGLALTVNGASVFPLGSISLVDTVLCNETGDYLVYLSDEHGFHNPLGLYDAQGVQIIAVGDSYTQGACVKSQENAIAVIRERYPRTLNLGVGGAGPLTMLALIREYAAFLKPRIVLWMYAEHNDLWDLLDEQESYLTRYLDPTYRQGLWFMQQDIDVQLRTALNERIASIQQTTASSGAPLMFKPTRHGSWSMVMNHLTLGTVRSRLGLYVPKAAVDWELLRTILAEATSSVEAWGGRLYVVYIPHHASIKDPAQAMRIGGARFREPFLSLVEGLNLPIIDVRSAFQHHPDPLSLYPFRVSGHANAAGYRLMGETILNAIERSAGVNGLPLLQEESHLRANHSRAIPVIPLAATYSRIFA